MADNKKYTAFVQYDGEEQSRYIKVQFEAPEGSEDLESIAQALADDILKEEYEEEEPCIDDYNGDDESYEEDLETYQEDFAEWLENWSCESVDIVNPEDYHKFRESIKGLVSSKYSDEEKSFEFHTSVQIYECTVTFDKDGKVVDVSDVNAQGLEWEGIAHSGWAECYPNYDYVKNCLIKEINE